MSRSRILSLVSLLTIVGCGSGPSRSPEGTLSDTTVFFGGQLFDGTGAAPIPDAVIVVSKGRIVATGPRGTLSIPDSAQQIDLSGRYVVPGLINSHGHVGLAEGLASGGESYNADNVRSQLLLHARYGITTVISLGSEGRDDLGTREMRSSPGIDRARLYRSGPVLAPSTAAEAEELVSQRAAESVDFIKIRVDDNLGSTEKMLPEVYQAVISSAHEAGLPVAAHLFYLEDSLRLLESGADFLAHSIRDRAVDDTLIAALKEKDVCVCPTLVREVSTFVYESTPDFFDDPFFLQYADPAVVEALKQAERQEAVRRSESAQRYKRALEMAKANLKALSEAGVTIAFGTDSGPPARFQGYFEHLEMDLMREAGLTSRQILLSATRDAARCLDLHEDLGTLEPGKWADFVVLRQDPLDDIRNMRDIDSVWIAGNRVRDR